MPSSKKESSIVFKKNKSGGGQKGVSLYLALMIMVILLGIALGVSTIFITQTRMLKEMGNSVIAFYAADTGIERVLYENPVELPQTYNDFFDLDGDGGGLSGDCPDTLIDPDDACYKARIAASSSEQCIGTGAKYSCTKSTGYYKGIRRAIRIKQ